MSGVQLQTFFKKQSLKGLLEAWAPVDARSVRQDVAERLGVWLTVADAIALHAAHQSSRAPATAVPVAADASLEEACEQVHAALAGAIVSMPLPGDPAAPDASFAPYHQRCLDLQRHMALRIEGLREQVRQAMAQASPRLAQLAALDEVMDQALGAREQKLLAGVPALLEQRFGQLCQPRSSEEEPPPVGVCADGLDAFVRDMRAVLLAELDVRMLPVQGLVEAFNSEISK